MKGDTLDHDPQTRPDTALTRSPALFFTLTASDQVRDLEDVVSLNSRLKTTVYHLHNKSEYKKL